MDTIDFREPGEPEIEVKVLPSAVKGGNRSAKPTPVGERRIQYDNREGPESPM